MLFQLSDCDPAMDFRAPFGLSGPLTNTVGGFVSAVPDFFQLSRPQFTSVSPRPAGTFGVEAAPFTS
jgi:hypothetical protein